MRQCIQEYQGREKYGHQVKVTNKLTLKKGGDTEGQRQFTDERAFVLFDAVAMGIYTVDEGTDETTLKEDDDQLGARTLYHSAGG
ncbi:hypothetical protein BY996DRAFT_8399635 [Phakopsora pachyrhizi]|nr:hypothetical protein BY996DRAFT_8399635 [Phakopsora pachyrhizi]